MQPLKAESINPKHRQPITQSPECAYESAQVGVWARVRVSARPEYDMRVNVTARDGPDPAI